MVRNFRTKSFPFRRDRCRPSPDVRILPRPQIPPTIFPAVRKTSRTISVNILDIRSALIAHTDAIEELQPETKRLRRWKQSGRPHLTSRGTKVEAAIAPRRSQRLNFRHPTAQFSTVYDGDDRICFRIRRIWSLSPADLLLPTAVDHVAIR
jgi:hypothetical protein